MKKLLAAVLAAFALMTVACEEAWKEPRGRGDAPVGSVDDGDAAVTNMPDQFPNIATKCLNGADDLRVVAHSRSDPTQGTDIEVVTDPSC